MEKPKRKVVLAITKATWGGASRYVYELATSLPAGFSVSVMAGTRGLLAERLQEAGIPLIPIEGMERDIRWFRELAVFFRTYAAIRDERPDILHLNSAKMAGIGAAVGRLLGVPHIIVTGHGWTFREERPWFQRGIILFLQWITVMLSHTTITITKNDHKALLQMPFVSPRNTHLISIGANRAHYHFMEKHEARSRLRALLQERFPERDLSALNEEYWIGANGELTKNKDYPTLFRALTEIPRVPLVVMSAGVDEARLAHLAKELDLEDRVFLAGFVLDAANYVPAFTVFTLTSVKEGLPYVILEAGLAGVPVVATRVGAVPDVISDGRNGLLATPKDSSAIARSIQTILNDEALRKRLGTSLFETVTKHFSSDQMVKSTVICYQ